MDIITIIEVISLIFVPIQIFLIYKQIKIAQNQMNENRKLSKINATLKILEEYSSLIMKLDNILLDKIKLLSLESYDFNTNEMNILLKNVSNRKQLFMVCDYFERLSLNHPPCRRSNQ